jgi:hypothetical protein
LLLIKEECMRAFSVAKRRYKARYGQKKHLPLYWEK